MTSAVVSSPVVSAALRTAGEFLGVEAVFLGTFDEQTITLARVHGPADWVALREGRSTPRRDSLCQRMLDGGPAATSDAEHDPAHAPAATRSCLGLLT